MPTSILSLNPSSPSTSTTSILSSSPVKPSSLEDAISTFPSPQLRKLLTHLIRISDENHRIATERLLMPLSVVAGTKRKRWETCRTCDKDFDVTVSAIGECRRHPGTKEPDHRYDFWTELNVEFDEDLLLSEQHVRDIEFEDGFMWSCCEQPLNAEGCVVCEHEAGTDKTSLKRKSQDVASSPKKKKTKRVDSVVADV